MTRSSSAYPTPSIRRSSSWRARCARSPAIALSSTATWRRPLGLAQYLGGFVRACRWVQGVVPVAVELVAGEDAGGFERFHGAVGDLDTAGVGAGVEFGVHGQPGVGGDGLEGFDDDFVGFQGASAPVAADRGE